MSKETGGSAFPVPHHIDGNWVSTPDEKYTGMTLRDWFASNAPSEVLSIDTWTIQDCCRFLGIDNYNSVEHYPEVIAKLAYLYADAMLKQRKNEE